MKHTVAIICLRHGQMTMTKIFYYKQNVFLSGIV
jgi:hypothetical protein